MGIEASWTPTGLHLTQHRYATNLLAESTNGWLQPYFQHLLHLRLNSQVFMELFFTMRPCIATL